MRSVVVVLPCVMSVLNPRDATLDVTHRINVGNDANVADTLNSGLVVSMLARVAPRKGPCAGQLGIFQHQYRH